MDKHPTHILTRGDKRDAVIFALPTLPMRLVLINARRAAAGFDLVDVVDEETGAISQELQQVRDGNGDDLNAVAYAVLGACWRQPRLQIPESFRDCGRDAIAWGEVVMTCLWDLGYREHAELMTAAVELLDWMTEATFGMTQAIEAEREGFDEAQQ